MKGESKPMRSEAGYDEALAEVERLWGAKLGTPEGDRLDILATLIEAYEDKHHPMDPIPAGGPRDLPITKSADRGR